MVPATEFRCTGWRSSLETAPQTCAFQVHGASNAFGIGDYNLPYLNNIGFRLAASYRNVEEIRKELEPEVKSA